MSLARIKVWNPGDTLTAADLNGEVNNILNNPRSLINSMTGAAGDVWTATGANTWSSLAIGTLGQILAVSGGLPVWSTRGMASQVIGLVGANDAVTPNTKFGFSADAVVLRNPTDSSTVIQTNTGTITNDTGLAGSAANGRDQAAAFVASSWLHFYFIWNGTVLASLSSMVAPPTGPALPAGYTHWAYAGAVRYDATPVLVKTRMRGSWARPEAQQAIVTNGAATVETAVALTTVVPPNALHVQMLTQANISLSTNTLKIRVISGSDYYASVLIASAVAAPIFGTVLLPNQGQQFFYLFAAAPTGADGLQVAVQGYQVPNGGE